jgi:hypothetical protein
VLGDLHLIISSEVLGMAYRKRLFLNPLSVNSTSFIQAIAESSFNGEDPLANYILIIADCDRRIMLEFALGSAYLRKHSLAKIDRLARVVNEFREAVHAEAKLIEKQRPEK